MNDFNINEINENINKLEPYLQYIKDIYPIFELAMEFSHKSNEALMSNNADDKKRAPIYLKISNRLLEVYNELNSIRL